MLPFEFVNIEHNTADYHNGDLGDEFCVVMEGGSSEDETVSFVGIEASEEWEHLPALSKEPFNAVETIPEGSESTVAILAELLVDILVIGIKYELGIFT